MAFRLFSRGEKYDDIPELEEEYVEVNVMDSQQNTKPGKIGIKIESLRDFADTDRILRHVREGHIVFLKIKELKDKDMGELKRAVDKIKKGVSANNGDIAGVEQNWLVLTPHYAAVHR